MLNNSNMYMSTPTHTPTPIDNISSAATHDDITGNDTIMQQEQEHEQHDTTASTSTASAGHTIDTTSTAADDNDNDNDMISKSKAMLLHLYDPLHHHIHRVEYSGANHEEVLNQELSSIEKFYVDVANVYTSQQQHRSTLKKDATRDNDSDDTSDTTTRTGGGIEDTSTAHDRRAESQHYQD